MSRKFFFALLISLVLVTVGALTATAQTAPNSGNPSVGDECVTLARVGFYAAGASTPSGTLEIGVTVTVLEVRDNWVRTSYGWIPYTNNSHTAMAMNCTSNPAATPEVYASPTPEGQGGGESLNVNEPLRGTLDDFGSAISSTDRFAVGDGTQIHLQLSAGEIWVANATAIQNGRTVSQQGCVVAYAEGNTNGTTEVFLTGWDGQYFLLQPESGISLNQAIAAMRETVVRAFNCSPTGIQYMSVARNTNGNFSAESLGQGGGGSPLDSTRVQSFFAVDGTIYDESYADEGELFVGYTLNGGTDQANGATIPACSILVYEAPSNGGRIRITVRGGNAYEWSPNVVVSQDAIDAVTAVAVSTNACARWNQYNVARFGNPVN